MNNIETQKQEEAKKEGWWERNYGKPWAEVVLALILAKLLQASLNGSDLEGVSLIILVPLVWVLVHLTLGKILDKPVEDIFKTKNQG